MGQKKNQKTDLIHNGNQVHIHPDSKTGNPLVYCKAIETGSTIVSQCSWDISGSICDAAIANKIAKIRPLKVQNVR